MRKATGLSRNRRKGAGPKPSNGQVQGTSNGNGGGGAANGTDGGGGGNGTDRRKQTPEEAQLSTKNYRLAKELVSIAFRLPIFPGRSYLKMGWTGTASRELRGGGRGGEAEQEAKGLPYFLAVMGQKGACEGEN